MLFSSFDVYFCLLLPLLRVILLSGHLSVTGTRRKTVTNIYILEISTHVIVLLRGFFSAIENLLSPPTVLPHPNVHSPL